MVDSTDIDIKQLQNTVKKLLDKAGTDARLTPRLLREKVEQRMKLEPGALTCKKSDIMDEIIKWWKETQPAINAKDSVDAHATELTALQSITKYAKAVGKGPHFLKEFLQHSDVEKARDIRKRLQEEGFVLSAAPTTEEIEEAKAKYQLQKELADIDPHSPIKRPRRPVAGDDETGTGTNDAKNSTDKKDDSNVMNSSLQKENQISGSGKKIKKNNSDDDEEAEF